MTERNVNKRLEAMQLQLREESHMRLAAEREQREAHAQYVQEHNARRDDLERSVGYAYVDISNSIKVSVESIARIEAYCFQAGACFPDELKKQRDELVKAVNEYHVKVSKLLDTRREQIRDGNFYGESKPEAASPEPQ